MVNIDADQLCIPFSCGKAPDGHELGTNETLQRSCIPLASPQYSDSVANVLAQSDMNNLQCLQRNSLKTYGLLSIA